MAAVLSGFLSRDRSFFNSAGNNREPGIVLPQVAQLALENRFQT
jgi:hypothetical protein